MKLRITHLYPKEMNLYGDLGNVICLQKRCEWRNIEVSVQNIGLGDELKPESTDIYFFGGGQDNDQLKVFADLTLGKHSVLSAELLAGTPMLAICGGYQLLGNFFISGKGNRIEGLKIIPMETIAPDSTMKSRAVGDLVTDVSAHTELINHYTQLKTLVGFENHSGRTRFLSKDLSPLGKVIHGVGDNEDRISDGVIFKNIFGSYMHGSLLPKNPHLADLLIRKALERRYNQDLNLEQLDDSTEVLAHKHILNRYK